MPTRSSAELLVDTSAAVALVLGDHAHHESTFAALGGRRLGLAGHAAFETYSVLTRLPPPSRRSPTAVAELLRSNFPFSRFVDPDTAAELLGHLPALGIAGGATYDALVAVAAASHGIPLATRDHRAVEIYRVMDAEVHLLD